MFRSKIWMYIALALVMIFVLSSLAFAQGGLPVQVSNNSTLGPIVVDAKNMTLYEFTADTANTSNCTAACIQAWPPLTVTKGTTPAAGSGVTGALATITADDGSTQVTMNQMPLYYFAQDKAAGDVKGQGVAGKWFVVDPSGALIKNTAQATGTVTATATTAPTAAPAATTAPTAAPTAAAAAAVTTTATAAPPGALPTTGGDASGTLLLPVLLGLLALAVGGMFGLRAARQSR